MNDNGKLSNYNIRERTKVRYQKITTNIQNYYIQVFFSNISVISKSSHNHTIFHFCFDNHKRTNKIVLSQIHKNAIKIIASGITSKFLKVVLS